MTATADLPTAPAALRNFEPLLGLLRFEFADRRSVLEIGSGTGQHAAGFADNFIWLSWQPTELPTQLGSIQQWVDAASLPNLLSPIALDVSQSAVPAGQYDAVFSANTAHIMNEAEVAEMFALSGRILPEGGLLCLYGPFRHHGQFSTESNARFDATLRRSDPAMGIRDVEMLDEFAGRAGLSRRRYYAMPGNNQVLCYECTAG